MTSIKPITVSEGRSRVTYVGYSIDMRLLGSTVDLVTDQGIIHRWLIADVPDAIRAIIFTKEIM